MVRTVFLFGACIFSFAAHGQFGSPSVVDTSIYAILNYDSSIDFAMDQKFYAAKATSLSVKEINDMEPLIDSSYEKYNKDNPNRRLFYPLTSYRRQYVAVINGVGQKEVWINFFGSSFGVDWRHRVLVVDDGGVGFFQLRINLSTKTPGELIPNGAA